MEKIAALEDALNKNSLVGIYSVFYTIAHGDPNFSTGKFRQVLEYVKSRGITDLFQEYDGEQFEPEEQWDEDYWALIASSLVDNFCMERIEHLEQVGKKVYPNRTAGREDFSQDRNINDMTGRVPYQTNNNYRSMNSRPTTSMGDQRKRDIKNEHRDKIQNRCKEFLNNFVNMLK